MYNQTAVRQAKCLREGSSRDLHLITTTSQNTTATRGRVQIYTKLLTWRNRLKLCHHPTRNEDIEMQKQPNISFLKACIHKLNSCVLYEAACRSSGPSYGIHMIPRDSSDGKHEGEADVKQKSSTVKAFSLALEQRPFHDGPSPHSFNIHRKSRL